MLKAVRVTNFTPPSFSHHGKYSWRRHVLRALFHLNSYVLNFVDRRIESLSLKGTYVSAEVDQYHDATSYVDAIKLAASASNTELVYLSCNDSSLLRSFASALHPLIVVADFAAAYQRARMERGAVMGASMSLCEGFPLDSCIDVDALSLHYLSTVQLHKESTIFIGHCSNLISRWINAIHDNSQALGPCDQLNSSAFDESSYPIPVTAALNVHLAALPT